MHLKVRTVLEQERFHALGPRRWAQSTVTRGISDIHVTCGSYIQHFAAMHTRIERWHASLLAPITRSSRLARSAFPRIPP